MKPAAFWAVRITLSLAIAILTLYFVVLLPKQLALDHINKQVNDVGAVLRAVESGRSSIDSLPSVEAIKVQAQGSAKGYVQSLDSLLPTLNVSTPEPPKILSAEWQLKKIEKYNAIVRNQDYSVVTRQSASALQESGLFFKHHRDVMYAVANLLEYNPAEDVKGDNPDAVLASLSATASGLEKTAQRINQASQYKNDESLKDVLVGVRRVQEARDAYENSINNTASTTGVEKDAFVAVVAKAQQDIIVNRQEFWASNRANLLAKLEQAENLLQPYAALLRNL